MNANSKLFTLLKFGSAVLCIVGFVCNSYIIFKQFIEGKRLTSLDIRKGTKLVLPSLTICRFSGYKEAMDEYTDLELVNFLNKTLDLEEILISIKDPHSYTSPITDIYKNVTHWKIKATYSNSRGRCHTIHYNQQVKNFNCLKYFFKNNIRPLGEIVLIHWASDTYYRLL